MPQTLSQADIDRLIRDAEERGRQEAEQRNMAQRMGLLEIDVRDVKTSVGEIKTTLAAHFGPKEAAPPPAPTPAPVSGPSWRELSMAAIGAVKWLFFALAMIAAGNFAMQAGPRAGALIEQGLK